MPRARMKSEVKARLLATRDGSAGQSAGLSGRHLVVESVRQWIFDGLLSDGDTVSQDDLADVLGISRIPVRDGLIVLEGSGWVVIDPGVGTRVVGLNQAAIEDSFEVFDTLWTLMIRRAVENTSDVELLLSAAKLVEEAKTSFEMTPAHDAFVSALCHTAQAPRLEAAFHNAGRIVPGDFFSVVPGSAEAQRKYVPDIGRAVASRFNMTR